jgi:hypothetical protein
MLTPNEKKAWDVISQQHKLKILQYGGQRYKIDDTSPKEVLVHERVQDRNGLEVHMTERIFDEDVPQDNSLCTDLVTTYSVQTHTLATVARKNKYLMTLHVLLVKKSRPLHLWTRIYTMIL